MCVHVCVCACVCVARCETKWRRTATQADSSAHYDDNDDDDNDRGANGNTPRRPTRQLLGDIQSYHSKSVHDTSPMLYYCTVQRDYVMRNCCTQICPAI